jgi:hypothetical protein
MAAKKTAAKNTAPKKTTGKRTAPKRMAKESPLKGMPVEQYIATKMTGWQAETAKKLVALVRATAPEANVAVKWGQPVFELNGPFAYLKPAKAHLTFGFWRGAELDDPERLLSGGDRMSHLKLVEPGTHDARALRALVRQAVKLNREKGDPTKRGLSAD